MGIGISIHAPRVGGDYETGKTITGADKISIHAPRVGGDWIGCCLTYVPDISIHAPRVGGDAGVRCEAVSISIFQSTPPVWGATYVSKARRWDISISIHAPRVGGDVMTPMPRCSDINFNPRPPCGGRRQKQLKIQAVLVKNRQFLQISSSNSYPILKNKVASLQIILQNLVRDLGDFLRAYVSHLKHQYIFWVVGCLYSKMLDLVFIAVSQVIKTKTVLFRVHDLTQLCL